MLHGYHKKGPLTLGMNEISIEQTLQSKVHSLWYSAIVHLLVTCWYNNAPLVSSQPATQEYHLWYNWKHCT